MSILDKLKNLPGFPLLNKEGINLLKASCNKEAIRIKRIPQSMRKKEDTEEEDTLKELKLYDELLPLLTQPQSAYDLLPECEIENIDDDTVHKLISYWQEQFNSALTYEKNPLSLSSLLSLKAANPILLAALIHSLIQKGITANGLLHNSPLLYKYVLVNTHDPDRITDMYALLEKTKDYSNPEVVTTLCTQVMTTIAFKTKRADFTLSGRTEYHAEEYVPYEPLMHTNVPATRISLSSDNLNQLNGLFAKEEFLLYLLQLPSSAELNQWLTPKITSMTVEEVNALYKYTLSSVDEAQRVAMLEKFSGYISDEQALTSVKSGQGYLWIVLSNKPKLLKELSPASLKELVNNSPITIDNMSYALTCLSSPELQDYNDDVRLKTLQCLMKNPTFEMPASVLKIFKQHPQASVWCKEVNDQILANFNQDILDNIPLTEDSYISIIDSYRNKIPQWRMLEKLSPSALHYPHDIYGTQGYIMKGLHDIGQLTTECLDIFHPSSKFAKYSESERITAKERTLLTCLTGQNDPTLQDWIINTIRVSPYNISNLQRCVINDAPIIDIAIAYKNVTFIKRYYSLFPEDIIKKDSLDNETVLHKAASSPESLKAILELLPSDKRLAAVQEKNKNNANVLHKAVSYPESLKAILELLPENERLAAVKEKNTHGNTLLHKAVSYPESLTAILELLPENERLAAVKEKNADGRTVLSRACSYQGSLKAILELLPENERLATVKEKDTDGWTLLHRAVMYSESLSESLKVILTPYPENERLAAVKEKDTDGNTVLHIAVHYPESLKVILALFPENERLAAVKEKDTDGKTLLHRAVHYPESLKIILALYPENERLAAVKEKNADGNTVLYKAASYPEYLKAILELLPENERLAAVKEKDTYGDTLLHLAIHKPASLKAILALLPENERLAAVIEKNSFGNTVLHKAVSYPESLKAILELLPENERLAAVKEKNAGGNTVLHIAVSYPESLKAILELLPNNARLAAVKEKNTGGNTVLGEASLYSESLKVILALYPENERLAAVIEKNAGGKTLLHRASNSPEYLKAILELLPNNARLAAAKEKSSSGYTLLGLAIHKPASLKAILEPLSENERLAAVKEKDTDGMTLLHRAVHYPETLKVILALYPENERLAAVKEKDTDGNTLLHRAIHDPESLKVILALYPENERFAAVKEKSTSGYTLLHRAMNKPASLKAILEPLSENERLAVVKEKDTDGNTLLHELARYSESLKVILALYPENERLAAVKEKNADGNTVLLKAASYPESLKAILELLPENERLAAVKEKGPDGKITDLDKEVKNNLEQYELMYEYIGICEKYIKKLSRDLNSITNEPKDKKSLDYLTWQKFKIVESALSELKNPVRSPKANINTCINKLKEPENVKILSKRRDSWLVGGAKIIGTLGLILIYRALMGDQVTTGIRTTNLFAKKFQEIERSENANSELGNRENRH